MSNEFTSLTFSELVAVYGSGPVPIKSESLNNYLIATLFPAYPDGLRLLHYKAVQLECLKGVLRVRVGGDLVWEDGPTTAFRYSPNYRARFFEAIAAWREQREDFNREDMHDAAVAEGIAAREGF